MSREHPIQIGVFQNYMAAERAIGALLDAGYPAETISVICPAHCAPPARIERIEPAGSRSAGVALGGGVGGILGGLTAAVGVVGGGGIPLLVVGPLLAGAVIGGFVGAMTSRGLEHELADDYDRALGNGQILVAVDTTHMADLPPQAVARRVLAQSGAETRALPGDRATG